MENKYECLLDKIKEKSNKDNYEQIIIKYVYELDIDEIIDIIKENPNIQAIQFHKDFFNKDFLDFFDFATEALKTCLCFDMKKMFKIF